MTYLDTDLIDLHAHFVPKGFWELVSKYGGEAVQVRRGNSDQYEFFLDGEWWTSMCSPLLEDWDARLDMMDRTGISQQFISITANPHVTWAEPKLGLELSQMINDELVWASQKWPGRIGGFAAVPLQDVNLACEELTRAIGMGLAGVMVPTHVGDYDLDDVSFEPFWEFVHEQNVPVFLHNQALGGDPRVPPHLRHVLGAPMETTIAATRLLFSGLMDRYPRLRVLLTHGGGAMPYIIGRLEHGWNVMSDGEVSSPKGVLGRLYFDTVLHDNLCVKFLIERVGPSHVVIGSDYPYPMGQEPSPTLLDYLQTEFNLASSDLRTGLRDAARSFLGVTDVVSPKH